ncbi:MAG: HAMP domain-containing sensor histidine kinase [Clostridia bacterium]|nr:HAMP domain-containing sensor histidine kinase [Clostridia bacterium]MDD4386575.1 HAMP domain-containing sensor histidine kinase [Clostridia bacterium]
MKTINKLRKKISICNKIIISYIITTFITVSICYPLIPILLNYPPHTVNNEFQLKIVPTYYWVYFILIFTIGMLLEYFAILSNLKTLKKVENNNFIVPANEMKSVFEKISSFSVKIFIYILIIPIIVLTIVMLLLSVELLLTFKVIILIFIIISLSMSISYMYVKGKIKYVLKEINNTYLENKKTSIETTTYIQILPLFLVGILILTLVMLSQFSKELSNKLFFSNKYDLQNEVKNITNDEELSKYIEFKNNNKEKDKTFFYITSDNKFVFDDNSKASKMFVEYFKEFAAENGGRIYDDYGIEAQGIVIFTNYSDKVVAIGYRYNIIPTEIYNTIFITIGLLVILYLMVVRYYAGILKEDIESISKQFSKVSESGDILDLLPITYSDEMGKLQNEYNNIKRLIAKHIKEIEDKQDVIVKQGQLVSIGELAGGVAHDINTPISAIKTGIQMLTEMYAPRDETEKELLFRMTNCTEKIIKIVNSMRNQIRNLGSDQKIDFKVSEVINDIKIIAYNEIQKSKCELNIKIEDDLSVYGDPTKLGQVFTNLILNAIQAYDGKGGKIEITVIKAPSNKILISVRDYAGGIPERIKEFVFKNILTTKGTNGTGLGLYLAYSVIKGEFSGEITFESAEGQGTTFYIVLDNAKQVVKEVEKKEELE